MAKGAPLPPVIQPGQLLKAALCIGCRKEFRIDIQDDPPPPFYTLNVHYVVRRILTEQNKYAPFGRLQR